MSSPERAQLQSEPWNTETRSGFEVTLSVAQHRLVEGNSDNFASLWQSTWQISLLGA